MQVPARTQRAAAGTSTVPWVCCYHGAFQVVRKAGQAHECVAALQASCFAQFSSKEISFYCRKLLEWPELQSEDLEASRSVAVEIKSSCFRAQAKL